MRTKQIIKKSKTTKNEILTYIRENGGFSNFNHWNKKEIKQYIKSYYNCSDYIANEISLHLN